MGNLCFKNHNCLEMIDTLLKLKSYFFVLIILIMVRFVPFAFVGFGVYCVGKRIFYHTAKLLSFHEDETTPEYCEKKMN